MQVMQARLAALFASRGDEHAYSPWGQVTLVLSTTASAGEGEHKIMNILRHLAPLQPTEAWSQLHATIRDTHVGEPPQFFPGAANVGEGAVSGSSPVHVMVYGNDADWMPLLLGITNGPMLHAALSAGSALAGEDVWLRAPALQCSILRPASKDAMFRSGVLKKGQGHNKFGKKRRRNKRQDAGKVVGAHAEHASASHTKPSATEGPSTVELPVGVASAIYELIPLNELWLELGVHLMSLALVCSKAQGLCHEKQGAATKAAPPQPLPTWISASKIKVFRKELGGGAALEGPLEGTVSSAVLWLAARCIDDFVCLLTDVGNDFLAALPGVSMRHNVRSVLLRDRGLGLDAVVEGYITRVLLPGIRSTVSGAGSGWVCDETGLPLLLFDRRKISEAGYSAPAAVTAAPALRLLGCLHRGISVGAIVRLACSEAVQHAEHGALLTAVDGVVDAHQGGMRTPVAAVESGAGAAAACSPAAAPPIEPVHSGPDAVYDPNDVAAAVFDMDSDESEDSEDERALQLARDTVDLLSGGQAPQVDELQEAASALADVDQAAPTQDVHMHSAGVCPVSGAACVAFSQVKLDHYFNKMRFMFEEQAAVAAVGIFKTPSASLQAAVSQVTLLTYPAFSD
jgi:hypothetical protein